MSDSLILPQPFGKISTNGKFIFEDPLTYAKVLSRPNRFIAIIELPDGSQIEAHCPTTGSIGGWEISGLNCLISGPHLGKVRRTSYTLEALEVPLASGAKELVGINQGAANRYVEASLLSGQLTDAVGPINSLKREKKLGSARIDFNVDDEEFIEVKTPLQVISLDTLVPVKSLVTSPPSVDRLVKHVQELTSALDAGQKAILLTCFIYDAPEFNPSRKNNFSTVFDALEKAERAGLERWQVNYAIDAEGVSFSSLRKLTN